MKQPDAPIGLNNTGKQIKIMFKESKKAGYLVYLVYRKMINRQTVTEKKSLGLTVYLKRTTRTQDVDVLKKAMAIRDKLEIETADKLTGKLAAPEPDDNNDNNNESDLIGLMEQLSTISKKKDKLNTFLNWEKATIHVKRHFDGNNPKLDTLSRKDALSFVDYLESHLKPNTANTYFQKFKQALNYAIEQEIISHNPAYGIRVRKEKADKHYLSIDELKQLEQTESNDINIKNAFRFACFTGLRWGDLLNLKFSNIIDGVLEIRMQKTGKKLRFKLPEQALEIIECQKAYFNHIARKESESVFYFLPMTTKPESYGKLTYQSARKRLIKFVKSAGINKKITWHNSRHTFASICQSLKIDLNTIRELLGHTDIKVTQVYLKDIEAISDDAIDKISNFKI